MVLSNSQGGRNLEHRPFKLGLSQLILEAGGQKDHTHFWSDVEERRKCIFFTILPQFGFRICSSMLLADSGPLVTQSPLRLAFGALQLFEAIRKSGKLVSSNQDTTLIIS